MGNRVAASIASRDTDACLTALEGLAPYVAMAEVRLDLMESFDLRRLISGAASPLIVTCRAPREGGNFAGSEKERLDILQEAMDLECDYVDVEWDCVVELRRRRNSNTKLIASRHWRQGMPSSLRPDYESLRAEADAVKLVGFAQRLVDVFPVFDFMRRAETPVIGLAMGECGRLTRLLGPCFAQCLLTYCAINSDGVTAPGQFALSEMIDVYHLDEAGPETPIRLHLCATPESARAAISKNSKAKGGTALHVAVVVAPDEADEFLSGVREYLPQAEVWPDERLSLCLPEHGRLSNGSCEEGCTIMSRENI
jgi:3-dehydroquinate dehydratase type I